MLDDLTTFLSTSTIHGLAYLPASRRLARLFWLLVVVSGFSTATYLIVKSFRGWEESPISTSISVLPITQITFPNLTVCPPRGTFTSLNYDLLRAGNRSLEDNSGLGEFIADLLAEEGYQSMLEDLDNFYEKDRFRHWYEGLSQISLSYWEPVDKQKYYIFETLGRLST